MALFGTLCNEILTCIAELIFPKGSIWGRQKCAHIQMIYRGAFQSNRIWNLHQCGFMLHTAANLEENTTYDRLTPLITAFLCNLQASPWVKMDIFWMMNERIIVGLLLSLTSPCWTGTHRSLGALVHTQLSRENPGRSIRSKSLCIFIVTKCC